MEEYKLKYPKLFEPLNVGPVTYRNRLFAAPSMMSFVTEGGRPTEALLGYYREEAKGGAAQVTVGDTPVDQEHAPAFPGLYLTKANMAFLGELAQTIKSYGAVATYQLNHAGWMGNPELSGSPPISPIAFTRGDGIKVMQMDEDMMKRVAENFASAALFVKECGFDGAQIHGGHGWLLAQFLSPMVNTRTDEYGGSPENRAKFPRMVVERIREAVGSDFVLEYRISGSEADPKGLTLAETIPFIQSIQDKIDLVHVSAGIDTRLDLTLQAHPSIFQPHGCNVKYAEAMKKAVNIPVVTVGAISTPEMAEQILEEGRADAVAMCRALIADPYLPLKARTGREDEICPCIRCLHCRGHMDTHKHFSCSVNPRAAREARYPQGILPSPVKKKVLVIGGGPGGMKAALTAKERGHDVIIVDKNSSLGGMLLFTDYDDIKADLRAQKNYLVHMVEKKNIPVILNTTVDRAWAQEQRPDVIVVATGASPVKPRLPGVDGPNVICAAEIYGKMDEVGKNVVFIGGGLFGVETALFLADNGRQVTVIEMTSKIAPEANRVHAEALRLAIKERDLTILTDTACKSIEPDGVVIRRPDGSIDKIMCDTAAYYAGMRPNQEVFQEVHDCAPEVYCIGSCIKPGTVREAILTGYYTAAEI
ncbi:MAG: FAD-dependent oxidoreductase [Oscillospiraceae bacterium]|jgi:2,4-dienoyl-CoA reductase-like NADH-dependent reductase (Old Yellow Enzyme family)/thioredoxin reductase